MSLPTDAKERKNVPMVQGLLDYFPDALAAVADVSRVGNDQHNPGQPIHWAKHLSTDHPDCLLRHLVDRGLRDTDGLRHSAKVAWRALAYLQMELEAEEQGVSYDTYIRWLKEMAENERAAREPAVTAYNKAIGDSLEKLQRAADDNIIQHLAKQGLPRSSDFDVVCDQRFVPDTYKDHPPYCTAEPEPLS